MTPFRLLLLSACIVGVAFAVCPNSCSGHGTCDAYDTCSCFKEGKALYLGAGLDPITGGDPRDLTTTIAGFRTADVVITCTDYSNLVVSTCASLTSGEDCDGGSADNTAPCEIDIRDGGSGYMVGTSLACTSADDSATVQTNRCPVIGYTSAIGDDKGLSGHCAAEVTDGAITEVTCVGAGAQSSAVTSRIQVSVSPPSYEAIRDNARIAKAQYTGPDCSLMTCPRGMSFINYDSTAKIRSKLYYTHVDDVECSDVGMCDRSTGACQCNPGFEGKACQRTSCADGCSGHGICQSNVKFAQQNGARYRHAWDSGKEMGCKCDSGWRGVNCAQKECPSNSDPLGYKGNTEGRDCSGRGMCDYGSGTCECFSGYSGMDCNTILALV